MSTIGAAGLEPASWSPIATSGWGANQGAARWKDISERCQESRPLGMGGSPSREVIVMHVAHRSVALTFPNASFVPI